MKRTPLSALTVAAGLLTAAASQAQVFNAGDLVVSTYGNAGTNASTGNYQDGVPTPITLEEYTTSGSEVNALTLSTANQGSNVGIVGEYGSSSEGTIQLSGNGQYLTINGYSADPSYAGTGAINGAYSNANGAALAQSTDTDVPRVFALIDANGNVNSSTLLNDVYSTNNPRSSYTPDGSTLYISGQGSGTSDQGLFKTSVGTNTVTQPSSAPTPISTTYDTRVVEAYSGNLYYSQDKKNKSTGIFMYNGMPTSASATATQIIPASVVSGSTKLNLSPTEFFFADPNTLYVADTGLPKAGGTSDGGIQKWVLTGNTWSLKYTLTDSNFVAPTATANATHGETGFEALTGSVSNGVVSLYAVSYTAGDADPNGLYSISDVIAATSSNATFTELVASSADSVFKGVSFAPSAVPEPSTYALGIGGLALLGTVLKNRASRRRANRPDCTV